MLYLADSARNGAALGTVQGWCAAINRVHLEAGLAPPGPDGDRSITQTPRPGCADDPIRESE